MKKVCTVLIVILLLVVLAFSAFQIYRLYTAYRLSRQAEAFAAVQEYERAKEIYDSLGKTEQSERCDELIRERDYERAGALLASGSYAEAEDLIATLGGYLDSEDMRRACELLRADALIEQGELLAARNVLIALGDYTGAAEATERVNALLYERADALSSEFKIKEACEIWDALGSYADCRTLSERGKRILSWSSMGDRLTDTAKQYKNNKNVYYNDACYIVVPESCNSDTSFFLYFPGGRNDELQIDYFLYYLMNPAPNTIAVFMRKNGLGDMQSKCSEAIELTERVAAECGVFVKDIVLAGSSLGAYPAMHGALYLHDNYAVDTRCVLSLDAGSDWLEVGLLLDEAECRELAQLQIPFYLFESPWVGMNREGIRMMVNAGGNITMVGCYFDDHTRITLDAMGMGVVEWAEGDRTEPCNPEMYTFTKLEPDI